MMQEERDTKEEKKYTWCRKIKSVNWFEDRTWDWRAADLNNKGKETKKKICWFQAGVHKEMSSILADQ